jgi:pimeloyl-ACP methyl ester carboxylesterase
VNVNNHRLLLPDGALMHVEDSGDGPPVVFTHGWTAGWEMREYQMSALPMGATEVSGWTDEDAAARQLAGWVRL